LGGSEPGSGVTVDDCARASRALETWLDDAGVAGPKYILEVSSPGIERPIRWPEHWQRYLGQDVNVRIPRRGRVRATIVDVVDDGGSVVLHPSGETSEVTVSLEEVRDATLAVDWS
jgi:ribosome maturation factor RimP